MNTKPRKRSQVLYCLDELREFITPQNALDMAPCVLQILPRAHKQIDPQSGAMSVFVTRADLKKILSCVSATEAKALEYIATNGALIGLMKSGKVGLRAKDVAICLGYTNPDEAIEKYCKSVEAGYIPKDDVIKLVVASSAPNSVMVGHWLVQGILEYTHRKENNL